MNNEQFLSALENLFSIHEHDDCVELETWTDWGVNMIIALHKNENKSYFVQFKEYVYDFDVDEEIDVHRQDKRYRDDFTIRQSVKDFESFESWLHDVLEKLETEVC